VVRKIRSVECEPRRESRRVSRRRGPDRRTGNTGSARWHRANRARNRVHHRVANARRDGLHKLTTELAATYGAIAVEDLNVAGMLRNRRLARAIADTGFATLRHQLAYKTQWRGSVFAVADRWYPSSKTCSDCKAVKSKLSLSERVFLCQECGLVGEPRPQCRTQPRRPGCDPLPAVAG
jgi:putative transposase